MEKRLSVLETQVSAREAELEALDRRLAGIEEKVSELGSAKSAAVPESPVQADPPGRVQPVPAASPEPQPAPAQVEPRLLYQEARDSLLKGDYDKASRLFKEYALRNPDGELADNALYWLGECHYSQGRYQEAAEVFKDLVQRYPKGGKQYPFTPAGEKAEQKLKLFQ
jgi:TolA-binding protein